MRQKRGADHGTHPAFIGIHCRALSGRPGRDGAALRPRAPPGGADPPGSWHLTEIPGRIPGMGRGASSRGRGLEASSGGICLQGGGRLFIRVGPAPCYVGLARGRGLPALAARVETALAPWRCAGGPGIHPATDCGPGPGRPGPRKGREAGRVGGRLAGRVARCAVDRFVQFRSVLGPRAPYEVLRNLAGG
jgi:hypothetical protein